MSYLEKGFDIFLNRSLVDTFDIGELPYDKASTLVQAIPGSNVIGGQTKSADGKLYIDWDSGAIVASDGARRRVVIGYVEEENGYGIKVYDAAGNEVFSVAGQLQSSGLADGSVATAKIADSAVTTVKIANLAVTNAKITSMAADKITAGDLTVAVDVGNPSTGFIRLDGVNNRISVNDGTNDRIYIGEL